MLGLGFDGKVLEVAGVQIEVHVPGSGFSRMCNVHCFADRLRVRRSGRLMRAIPHGCHRKRVGSRPRTIARCPCMGNRRAFRPGDACAHIAEQGVQFVFQAALAASGGGYSRRRDGLHGRRFVDVERKGLLERIGSGFHRGCLHLKAGFGFMLVAGAPGRGGFRGKRRLGFMVEVQVGLGHRRLEAGIEILQSLDRRRGFFMRDRRDGSLLLRPLLAGIEGSRQGIVEIAIEFHFRGRRTGCVVFDGKIEVLHGGGNHLVQFVVVRGRGFERARVPGGGIVVVGIEIELAHQFLFEIDVEVAGEGRLDRFFATHRLARIETHDPGEFRKRIVGGEIVAVSDFEGSFCHLRSRTQIQSDAMDAAQGWPLPAQCGQKVTGLLVEPNASRRELPPRSAPGRTTIRPKRPAPDPAWQASIVGR